MSNTPIMFRPTDADLANLAAIRQALEAQGLSVNLSDIIRYAITRTRRETEMSQEQTARNRIDQMDFTAAELAYIWADWPNMDEHIEWLLTASRQEIAAWIAAGQ
jgi:Arc/MetJ-type ribon-helix-helix transcriptional regulator